MPKVPKSYFKKKGLCIACCGTGTSSKGTKCVPCNGIGKKLKK